MSLHAPHARNAASFVFLLGMLVHVLVLSRLAASHHLVPGGGDMRFYLEWASRIAAGQWTDHHAFYGLPGYAYWLAALLLATGRDFAVATLVAGGIQALAFAGIATLIFFLARDAACPTADSKSLEENVPVGIAVGVLAAGGWIAFTPAQAFSAILMPTVFAVFTFWLGVRIVSKASCSAPLSTWFLVGLILGVCALFVATPLFLVPLALVGITRNFLLRGSTSTFLRGALAGGLLLAGVLLGVSPAWLHNTVIASDPVVLSAHSGVNLWIGNNPEANGYPKMPDGLRAGQEELLRDSLEIPQREAGRQMRRSEISTFWAEKAKSWIRENPARSLQLFGTKFENFWNAFQYDDISVVRLFQSEGVTLGFSSFGVISCLGIAGLALSLWHYPYSRWIGAAVLLHMLALLPVFVTERYRLTAVPGLLIFATLGLNLLWQGTVSGRWRMVLSYLAIAAASAAFVTLPKGDNETWAFSNYNFGLRKRASGESAMIAKDFVAAKRDLDDSKAALELAFRYAPASTEINLALGNVWHTKADRARAELYYTRVLALDPTHLSALNNLGVISLEKGDWAKAIVIIAQAIELNPRAAKSHYLLAKAKLGAGDRPAALASVERALALQPTQKQFLALRSEIYSRAQ